MSHIFRDPTDGATARRADLLRRRRDELVMMPHAIRRVYVARRARTAASITIALAGAALLVIAAKPAWAAFLASGLPGINPAVLCTLVVAMWLAGMFAYVAARATDEHRFAVAMSRYVLPGKDLDEDLERLSHERPDQVAREMAHRLEVRSAALPVLAAGVLLPVTALYIGAAIRTGGWPVIAGFEASVAAHAHALLACAGVGAVLAVAATKRAARLPIVAPITGVVVLAMAASTFALTPWLVPVALIVGTLGCVVRRLRIERDLLEAEDPAAGSEIFTIRGALRQLRAAASAVLARVRTVRPIWVLVAGLLVIAGVTATKLLAMRAPLAQAPVAAVAATTAPTPTLAPTGSRSMVEVVRDGRVKIELELVDNRPVEIPAIAGLALVPPGWVARVEIKETEGSSLDVWFGERLLPALSIDEPADMVVPSCGIVSQSFGLRVQGAPGHYVLYVEPTLRPTRC